MKPTLYLIGQHQGVPTPDDIFALVRKLTGKDPSQAEKDEIIALHQARIGYKPPGA